MALSFSGPKAITFAATLPFLPYTRGALLPYLLAAVVLCLTLHTLAPNKAKVPLSTNDILVIALNLTLTALSAALFVYFADDHLLNVPQLSAIPLVQCIYPVVWILADESLFFIIHGFAHRPGVYDKCHKMHHKFKTTSAWTSFYSHPLDHSIAVVWAGLAMPLFMMCGMGMEVAVPVMALFIEGAIVTFIGSHHTIIDCDGDAVGTDHLVHHTRFSVNFGNFGYFDKMRGSYGTAKKTVHGWP